MFPPPTGTYHLFMAFKVLSMVPNVHFDNSHQCYQYFHFHITKLILFKTVFLGHWKQTEIYFFGASNLCTFEYYLVLILRFETELPIKLFDLNNHAHEIEEHPVKFASPLP